MKNSGKKYMMNETSCFHAAVYANRMQYQAGALGKLIYSEGEYYHVGVGVLGSYNPKNGKIDAFGWRRAMPPMSGVSLLDTAGRKTYLLGALATGDAIRLRVRLRRLGVEQTDGPLD